MRVMDLGNTTHVKRQRFVGWYLLPIEVLAAAIGAYDAFTVQPLPSEMSPANITAFLDLRRQFGVLPGMLGVVGGVGLGAVGLALLMGVNLRPAHAADTANPPPSTR